MPWRLEQAACLNAPFTSSMLVRRSTSAASSTIDTSGVGDRKSTRLNSSHGYISYAVFCLKKKNVQHDRSRSAYVLQASRVALAGRPASRPRNGSAWRIRALRVQGAGPCSAADPETQWVAV